jgi:hypothetical protein
MSWLTEYQEGRKRVERAIWNLNNLSNLLDEVGNDKLAYRISMIHDNLMEAHVQIDKAVMGNLDSQYKQAQQSSANVLKACLAGVKLAEDENQTKTYI